jgi:hypothetical protein
MPNILEVELVIALHCLALSAIDWRSKSPINNWKHFLEKGFI